MTFTTQEVEKIITDSVASGLDAEVVCIHSVLSVNGTHAFHVLWRDPEKARGGARYGVHSGVVLTEDLADLYFGKVHLTKLEANRVFRARGHR